jgi:hypothetical protein
MNIDYTKPYFNLTISACCAAGARGGRRSGRARRFRALAHAAATVACRPEPELETAHQASMLLDERFPHLRNAWPRHARRSVV